MTPIVDGLPQSPSERRALLDSYFSRRLADAHQRDDGTWSIELSPFDDAQMHVDPQLADGLGMWGVSDVARVPFAVRASANSQLSLEDSWTAVAWSRWLQREHADEVTILHVDDHDDLMAPLLGVRDDGRFDDLISTALVDPREPETVQAAVASGAIGVAGFMAPLLHTVARGEIRHLCASGYAQTRPDPLTIHRTYHSDDLLRPGALRPAVQLGPVAGAHPDWTYRATDDPDRWLSDLRAGPLLLHIDFDYFCNRFNGDSDWQSSQRPNDVGEDIVRGRVDALCAALDAAGVAGRVHDVTGALSPGFFPVSMWRGVLEQLTVGMAGIGLPVAAWTLA